MARYGSRRKPYADDTRNDSSGWVEIRVRKQLPRARDGCRIPFRLFMNRMASSSPDWESFLHDPLRQMLRNPGDLVRVKGWPSFPGDRGNPRRKERKRMTRLRNDPRWTVTTMIGNHHRRLSRIHASAMAIVGPDGIQLLVVKDAHQ
jgi:hypothetical protein